MGAGPVVARCGTRRALLAGLCLFDAFYVLFAACAWLGPCAAQWPIFLAGMPLVGFGAAIVFAAICVYMTGVGAILAEESPLETESEMLANLGGSLGAWSLGTELAYKLATSSLQALEFPTEAILVAWLAVALACTALMTATRDLPVNEDEDRAPALAPGAAGAIAAFFALWRDPCTWLLGFTTYTYAFSDALIVNSLDPAYVAPMLGTQAIGIVTATTSLSGFLLAKPYGFLAARSGKWLTVVIAAASFGGLAALAAGTGIERSGWAILLLFVLQGSGRAVTEGVNRAIFADFFAGPRLDAAYANYNFQMAALEALCNFAQALVSETLLLSACLALAVLSVPTYLLAVGPRRAEGGQEACCVWGEDGTSSGEEPD